MATANISSTFDIVLSGVDLNAVNTFIAPRGFTVVGCTAFNIGAQVRTVTLTGSTAGVFSATTAAPPIAGAAVVGSNATGAGGEPTQQVAIFSANATIVAGETVTVQANNADITRIVLKCVASGGGQAVTFGV